MLCFNLSGIATITVNNVGYCCIVCDVSKSDVVLDDWWYL